MLKKLINANNKLGFFIIYGLYRPIQLFLEWQYVTREQE